MWGPTGESKEVGGYWRVGLLSIDCFAKYENLSLLPSAPTQGQAWWCVFVNMPTSICDSYMLGYRIAWSWLLR